MPFTEYANEIIENLWLGSEEAGQVPIEELRKFGITSVLIPANLSEIACIIYPDHISYKRYYVADTADFPIIQLFEECFEFIDEARKKAFSFCVKSNFKGGILVHCAAGRSRSACIVIMYLMKVNKISFREAHNFVKDKRPVVSTKFEKQLQLWEQMGCSLHGDSDAHVMVHKMYKRSPFNKKDKT